MKEKAGYSTKSCVYSSSHPSRILQSEKAVAGVIKVLSEEYINRFHPTLDQSKLFNLSSGVPLENTEVLGCWELGDKKHKDFTEKRIIRKEVLFHDPIKKTKLTLFSNASSTKIKKNGKVTSIEVNRNIIGKLLAMSLKTGKQIDFEAALSFPLTQIPLSLANADGSRRTLATLLSGNMALNILFMFAHELLEKPADTLLRAHIISAFVAIDDLTKTSRVG